MSYGYDLLGRMASAATSSQTLSFTYDALGRNLTQVGPQGTVTSTWDIAGRRTRIAHPDGFYVDQEYLVTGEPTAIRENGATSGAGVLATYAWDDLGRRSSLTRGDGSVLTYSYDAVSRLTQLADNLVGTAYDETLGFGYTPASQIASNTRSNDAYAWTGHGSGTTVATSNGIAQSANGLNQIGSWVSTLGYDAKGNITSDGTYSYGYSSENLLTSLTNSATGAAQPSIAFAYDPLMRLAKIDSSNAAFDVDFGYDGQEMALEGRASARAAGRALPSIHMLEADPKIIPARHQGQSRRRPQAAQPHPVHPGPLRHRPAENQRPKRHQLQGGLPLGEPADGKRDLQAREELAKARDGDLAEQDDQGRDDVEAVDHRVRVGLAGRDQHDDHADHHDLVGDRIEKDAEPRYRPLGSGEIAVEIIGDPDQAVEAEGDRIIVPARLPEQEDEQGHRENSRQSEDVGQGQHRSAASHSRCSSETEASVRAEPVEAHPLSLPHGGKKGFDRLSPNGSAAAGALADEPSPLL